jgi:hypothetical protein
MNTDWIGQDKITPPLGGSYDDAGGGLETFINNGFRFALVAFGLYALLNFVLAAFSYMSAQGETKNIEKAKKLITNSVIALFMLAVTFIVAGLIGALFFGSWDKLLNLTGAIDEIINPTP